MFPQSFIDKDLLLKRFLCWVLLADFNYKFILLVVSRVPTRGFSALGYNVFAMVYTIENVFTP